LLIRYRYNYKDRVQAGVLADKDAGEPLFRHKQQSGFDFYSYHLFIRRAGIVYSLAIGDFTVNMGQGLIQWQSLSFRKGSELTTSKRQASVLRPYTSSGEFNFHRGAGISLRKKRCMLTGFVSFRKLSANLSSDSSDSVFISSFLISGLNRTEAEQAERNNVRQTTAGINVSYDFSKGHTGVNIIHYQFSHPFKKRDELLNLYSWQGDRLTNLSLDYDHTWRNLHLFGEIAISRHSRPENSAIDKSGIPGAIGYPAILQGLLISLDRKLGAGLVFRHLPSGFQSLNARAFTENTSPTNETGLYFGLSCKPAKSFSVDGYADVFRFPWLKFTTDAPSHGKEYMIQFTFRPNRRFELMGRCRIESKESNVSGTDEHWGEFSRYALDPRRAQPNLDQGQQYLHSPTNQCGPNNYQGPNPSSLNQTQPSLCNSRLTIQPFYRPEMCTKINWRYHLTWQLTPEIRLRKRIELVQFDRKGPRPESGFLMYYDLNYQPKQHPYGIGGRLQFFETDGFNSRIYAFENDVPSSYSIPAAYQKGWRYYFNFQLTLKSAHSNRNRRLLPPVNIAVKVAQTIPQSQAGIEFRPISPPDFKIQLLFFEY
ncbi:MAG TPA: hypothetical protein VGD17_05695, partial [Chitinophagaceae bacterium]